MVAIITLSEGGGWAPEQKLNEICFHSARVSLKWGEVHELSLYLGPVQNLILPCRAPYQISTKAPSSWHALTCVTGEDSEEVI